MYRLAQRSPWEEGRGQVCSEEDIMTEGNTVSERISVPAPPPMDAPL